MAQTNTDSQAAAIAYVPFVSLCTALDHLKSHGVPDKIDSSVFPTFSGSVVSHLLLSMRFLGLIDEKGHPQAALTHMVDDKTRKQALARILPIAYSDLFKKVDLAKASPTTLDEAIRSQHAKGATVRKAKVFLIKAAQFSGLQVSSHLLKRTRSAGGGAPTKSKTINKPKEREEVTRNPKNNGNDIHTEQRYSKIIKLPEAGGTLILSGDFDPFSLRGTEREFVYKLADLMAEFGSKGKVSGTK
jgi:hypothetical protein